MIGTEAGGRYAGASKKFFGQYEPERGHLTPAFAAFCDTIVKIGIGQNRDASGRLK